MVVYIANLDADIRFLHNPSPLPAFGLLSFPLLVDYHSEQPLYKFL